MGVREVLILAALALVIGVIPRPQVRTHLLLLVSLGVVYWLQSRAVEIYSITFWLPTFTLILVFFSWLLIAPVEMRGLKQNALAVALILLTVATIVASRYFGKTSLLFPDMAIPGPLNVFIAIALVGVAAFLVNRIKGLERFALLMMFLLIFAAFLMIKFPPFDRALYTSISTLTGNPQKPADVFVWLGFSYFAFRIIHTLRDRQKGLLPAVTLGEYVTYVLFFPAFVAGPIDRIQRFVGDLRSPNPLSDDDYFFAGRRLLLGLFKKFVLADALAMFSLNPKIFPLVDSSASFWLLLYAYTFQIYFDFSGYSDIAIGTAKLARIQLPENFNTPYLQPNLSIFWNNWHITLTQWFRAYFFNPLQRWLRSTHLNIPTWLMVLGLQLSTMMLIGIWHGITLNFILWGVWHALGLFLHNRWRESGAVRVSAWANSPLRKAIWTATGIFATFHYVAIGWVFFVLPAEQIPFAMRLLLGFSS